MAHIFISYSKQNKEYARKLADHLISQGFNVWIDDEIEPSDEWWKKIVRAVRECVAFLVIMTPEAGTSRWVEREVMLADELGKPMFPILLKGDLHASELWALFIGKQYEDARGDKLPMERFYAKLERSAPRTSSAGKNVTGSLSPLAEPSVSDAKLARFSKLKQALSEKEQAQQPLIPPDVSAILPAPFEWSIVPAGEVTVRLTPRAKAASNVPSFAITKYPITNSQYQVFLDADSGYQNPEWWGYSDAAKFWRREHRQPRKAVFEGQDLPVTNVTWYEAIAFCQWLNDHGGETKPGISESLIGGTLITLPTEQQWQRAAQSDDGREYPWGNQFEPTFCNTTESNIGSPTSVTQYPNGASPFGVVDMAGNVWEWCLSEWGTSEIKLSSAGERVLRGGAWDNFAEEATINSRIHNNPKAFGAVMGFRVVAISIGP